MRLYLKFPTLEDKEKVLDYKQEFLVLDGTIDGSGGLDRFDSYEDWLQKINNDINEKTCGEGRVPSALYLVYRKEDDKLIGFVQIRHKLNEFLLKKGGHIGDSVRPTERCKGYATEQISLALKECKKLGLEKVLITCSRSNIASAKTILKNNGILENEIKIDGGITQRYWIDLTEN